MVRKLIRGAFVLPVLCWAAAAGATSIPFVVSGGSATAAGFSAGTSVSTVSLIPGSGLGFPLAEGASYTFPFLQISASREDGTWAGGTLGIIQTSLNFAAPVGGSATGVLAGFAIILDSFSIGSVGVVNNPSPIAFGDNGWFRVTFQGFSTACNCSALSGTVTATVSLLNAPTSVPEPAALTLLGAGLAVFAFGARRRRQAKAA